MKWIHLAGVLAVAFVTGCVALDRSKFPKVNLGEPSGKPTAVIEVRRGAVDSTFNGSHAITGETDKDRTSSLIAKTIARGWTRKDLVRKAGTVGDLRGATPTHRLTVDGVVDRRGNLLEMLFSAATLYIIPSETTSVYDLNVTLERVSDGQVYDAHVENSVLNGRQIVLAPLFVFGVSVIGQWDADTARALHLYEEFYRQGAFDGHEVRSASH